MINRKRAYKPITRSTGSDYYWGLFCIGKASVAANQAWRQWGDAKHYTFNYIIRGRGTFIDRSGQHWNLEPSCAYHQTGQRDKQQLQWHTDGCVSEWFFLLDERLYERLQQLGLIDHAPVLRFADPSSIEVLMEDCWNRLSEAPETSNSSKNIAVVAILMEFLTQLQGMAETGGLQNHLNEQVRLAAQYLSQNPTSDLPLENLAEQVGMSYSSLRVQFRKQFDTSLHQYRIQQRIGQAKQLLLYKNVSEVADALHYSDAFSFSRQFKQQTRLSPSQYKRKHQF